MLYFDRIDVTERINVNKTGASEEMRYVSLLVFPKLYFYVSTEYLQLMSWFINDAYEP